MIWAYFGHILGIFWAYFGHTLATLLAYLGHNLRYFGQVALDVALDAWDGVEVRLNSISIPFQFNFKSI